jgi:hypothetical protein
MAFQNLRWRLWLQRGLPKFTGISITSLIELHGSLRIKQRSENKKGAEEKRSGLSMVAGLEELKLVQEYYAAQASPDASEGLCPR